ncbi:hydroxyacid dehydrogenase [Microbacterium indicum]|uniref:hydroxyacid dehydrogenase n=1 Tax=Microbacterium indicum TaxID=358100 RepID=UPI0003FEEAE2|nr:hydroxyacid dehydrogenase [Microbacterium indicum]
MTRPAVLSAVGTGALAPASERRLARLLAEEGRLLGTVDGFDDPRARAALAEAEVLVTGWGTPRIDAGMLAAAPRLRWILHVAGSVRSQFDRAVWERGIGVSSAVDANAVPVAEYTLAAILFANKRIVPIARAYRESRDLVDQAALGVIGNYRRTVGIIGASRIGRRVVDLLAPFELDVLLSDPTLGADEIRALGAEPATLAELFQASDVVSVHAPSLPATRGLVTRELIDAMRPGSAIINTARGEVVDQDALTDRVVRGDLFAVLDVTVPWVLPAEHPLYDHPNALLTPHIAGSVGTEVDRMVDAEIGELRRIAAGEPLAYPVPVTALDSEA